MKPLVLAVVWLLGTWLAGYGWSTENSWAITVGGFLQGFTFGGALMGWVRLRWLGRQT